MKNYFYIFCLLCVLPSCNNCVEYVDMPSITLQNNFEETISVNDTIYIELTYQKVFDHNTTEMFSPNISFLLYLNHLSIEDTNFVFQPVISFSEAFDIIIIEGEVPLNMPLGVIRSINAIDETTHYKISLKLIPKYIGFFAISAGSFLLLENGNAFHGGRHGIELKPINESKCKYLTERSPMVIFPNPSNNFDLYYNSPFFFPVIQGGVNITYESQKKFHEIYYFLNITN